MRVRGFFLLMLLLVACAAPAETTTEEQTAVIPPTETAAPTSEPTATTPPEPTETLAPTETPEPEPTATLAPTPTDTPEPTATAIPVETFSTETAVQERLVLFSETAVIPREQGNKYLNGGAIIFHDGQFHMFSNFFNTWPGRTVTYYYTSPDGQAWTRNVEEPLFTVDDVPLDGTGALALTGLVLPDGTWTLYYHTFTSGGRPGFIGRATATNPLGPWTFDAEPVLTPGSSGEWDDLQVMRVNVLSHNGGYVMYYAGVSDDRMSRIGMATSPDGIVWEKYDDPATTEAPYAESDPILVPALDWEGGWLGRPEVVQTDDGWVMFYEGGSRGSKTGLAVSDDGVNFTRYEANPILTTENMVNSYTFFQGALAHQDDTYYYLIEAGNGRIGTDIFLYTLEGALLDS
ncbi:MAG: hypothetical protein AAF614_18485 [Chloroflexota bacterium]